MPDRWGRPTMTDWMGMAQTVRAIGDSRSNRELNKERIAGLKGDREYNETVRPMEVERAKMEHDTRRHSAGYEAIAREAQSGLSAMVAARGPTDDPNTPGIITNMKGYRSGYEQVLNSYDLKNDQWDFVPGSVDWDDETIQIKDNHTGEVSSIPIPTENQIKTELGSFFSMQGGVVGTNPEGFKAFLQHGLMTDQEAREINNKAMTTGEVWENKEGKTLRKTSMIDFRGDGSKKEVWIDEAAGELLSSEEGAELARTGGFKSPAQVATALSTKETEADITKKKADAEYTKSWKKGKKDSTETEKIKRLMRIHNISEGKALNMYNLEKQKNSTIGKFLDQYWEQAGWLPGPKNEAKRKALAEELGVSHLVFGEKEKISITGGLPTQKTIVQTGTIDGRRVIKYSDGSIDYAN